MWKPLIRSAIAGSIIVYIWMTISWVLLPFHRNELHHFENENAVYSEITSQAYDEGVYVLPRERGVQEHSPYIFVNIKRHVDFDNMIRPMLVGYLIQLLGAFLVTGLLLQTRSLVYWHRVWFVTFVAITVGVLGTLPGWNWWNFSGSWAALEFADHVIAWFLAGLAIARLSVVRGKRAR